MVWHREPQGAISRVLLDFVGSLSRKLKSEPTEQSRYGILREQYADNQKAPRATAPVIAV
ncbi:hypothetical protein [Bradyrhizobium sp. Rc2d]|uniref:hypothetical protein n=1 Tax=Bradyrhizobium sp. Rc2d TaxID=1855321 RepID=UPI00115FBC79|nr:hypothetical protein [Bradyrhizobium sp. Rc2d]